MTVRILFVEDSQDGVGLHLRRLRVLALPLDGCSCRCVVPFGRPQVSASSYVLYRPEPDRRNRGAVPLLRGYLTRAP